MYLTKQKMYSNFEEMWADWLAFSGYLTDGSKTKSKQFSHFVDKRLHAVRDNSDMLKQLLNQPAAVAKSYFSNDVDWEKLLSFTREAPSFKRVYKALELREEVTNPLVRANPRAVLRDLQRFQSQFRIWLKFNDSRF